MGDVSSPPGIPGVLGTHILSALMNHSKSSVRDFVHLCIKYASFKILYKFEGFSHIIPILQLSEQLAYHID